MPNAQGFSSLCRLRVLSFFPFHFSVFIMFSLLSVLVRFIQKTMKYDYNEFFLFFAFFLLFRETATQLSVAGFVSFSFAGISARAKPTRGIYYGFETFLSFSMWREHSAWWEFRHHLGNIDKCAKSQKLTQLVDDEIEIIPANSQICWIQSFCLASSFINFFSVYKYSNKMRGMLSDFAKLDLCCDGECEKTNRISKRAREWIYDRKFPAAKSDLCLDLRSSGSKSYFIIRRGLHTYLTCSQIEKRV